MDTTRNTADRGIFARGAMLGRAKARLMSAAPATGRRLTMELAGAIFAGILLKSAIYLLLSLGHGGPTHAYCQWDCEWYVHTIRNGYDPEPRLRPVFDYANWAFFPLYPMLARLLRAITGISAFWSGTAISIGCFAAFAVLSCRYRAITRPGRSQLRWIVLLLVYPLSLYFFVPYTESLYLLVTILLLLAVEARDATGAGVVTALTTAARPTGVTVIPYLMAERAWFLRTAFQPGLDRATRLRIVADAAFPLAIAPLGLAGYMVYLYWLTGDALAFSHVQVAWGRQFINPLKTIYWNLFKPEWGYMLDPDAPQSKGYGLIWVVLSGLACLWLLIRRRFLETWVLATTVVLALTTSLASIPRYVTANPAFLLAVGDLGDRIVSRPLRVGLAMLCIMLQVVAVFGWFRHSTLLM